jgi:hypothetical protein
MNSRMVVGAVAVGVIALGLSGVFAQAPAGQAPAGRGGAQGEGAAAGRGRGPAPVKPPLFFKEEWKQPPYTGQLTDQARRLTPDAVTNPNLELKVYGPCKSSMLGVEVYGTPKDSIFPMNLWTGMCESPVAVTLRDKANFVDLTGSARIKWLFRAANLHAVRPVVRLASGAMLVGNHVDATPSVGQAEPDMIESEFSITPIRWYTLEPDKVVVMRPGPVDNPDLSKVDEVGFADLMPSGGHGNAGWINIGPFEVYGKPVKR